MTTVHEHAFTLLSGADVLREYNWNTGIARHFFCARCGIHAFHRKGAMPDHCGVNVHCLTGFGASTLAVRQAQGRGMSVRESAARDLWTGPREARRAPTTWHKSAGVGERAVPTPVFWRVRPTARTVKLRRICGARFGGPT